MKTGLLERFDPPPDEWDTNPWPFVAANTAEWYEGPLGILFVSSSRRWEEFRALKYLRAAAIEETSLGAITSGPAWEWSQQVTSWSDGPRHAELRGLFAPAFSASAVSRLRPRLVDICVEAIERLPSGPVDLVELANDIAYRAFGVVAGITDSAHVDMSVIGTATELANLWGWHSGRMVDVINRAAVDLRAVVDLLLREQEGLDTLYGRIAAADAEWDVRVAAGMQALVAGWETTVASILGICHTLLDDPSRLRGVVEAAWSPAAVVEECLRWKPPAAAMMRIASESFQWDELSIEAGHMLVAYTFFIARDCDAYDDPWVFNPARRQIDLPVWGFGAHRCMGVALATAELESLVEAIRVTDPVWALVEKPRWTDPKRAYRPIELIVENG